MATPQEIEECRKQYGEAHDDQMAVNGECGWCGHYDDSIPQGHVDEVTGNVYDGYGNLIEQHYFGA